MAKKNGYGHRGQPKDELEGVNIFFSSVGTSMTVNCFDEDSEMAIIVRDGKQKAIYSMTVWEAKRLKKWLTEHIKNEQSL